MSSAYNFVFKDAGVLTNIVKCVSKLVKEVNLECNPEGLIMNSIDSSQVSMLLINIYGKRLHRYKCDQHVSLGLNLDSVSKILKPCGAGTVVEIVGKDLDSVNFNCSNDALGRYTQFELKLLNIETMSLAVPALSKADALVCIDSGQFKNIIKDSIAHGDNVDITISNGSVTFSSPGIIGTSKITLASSDAVGKDTDTKKFVLKFLKVNKPYKARFSLKYLANFADASSLSKDVVIAVNEEEPIKIQYKIEDNNVDLGYLTFFLAPKYEGTNE